MDDFSIINGKNNDKLKWSISVVSRCGLIARLPPIPIGSFDI